MAGAISKVCLSLCIIIWNNVVGVTIIKQDPDAEGEKKSRICLSWLTMVPPALSGAFLRIWHQHSG